MFASVIQLVDGSSETYICGSCPTGLVGFDGDCFDENECEGEENPCEGGCVNTVGSFE